MPEAQLEDSGSGLAPVTDGWFAVNVRDAEWWISERRGAACNFESEERRPPLEFEQVGINVTVLEPGQSNGYYHSESDQEAFLVLSGECRLLVEGEERRLRQWDFAWDSGPLNALSPHGRISTPAPTPERPPQPDHSRRRCLAVSVSRRAADT